MLRKKYLQIYEKNNIMELRTLKYLRLTHNLCFVQHVKEHFKQP